MMQRSNGVAASVAALVIVVFGACGKRLALLRVTEARHQTADALVPLTKASEATNRAVETFEKRDSTAPSDAAISTELALKLESRPLHDRSPGLAVTFGQGRT